MFSEKSNAMTLNKTLTLKLILTMKVVNVKQHTFKYMSVRGMRVMKFDWRKNVDIVGEMGRMEKWTYKQNETWTKSQGIKTGSHFVTLLFIIITCPCFSFVMQAHNEIKMFELDTHTLYMVLTSKEMLAFTCVINITNLLGVGVGWWSQFLSGHLCCKKRQ